MQHMPASTTQALLFAQVLCTKGHQHPPCPILLLCNLNGSLFLRTIAVAIEEKQDKIKAHV